MYFPPYSEHDDLIKAALRVISATHYSRPEDPHGDAEHEYAGEQLALAARALVQAVDRKPADDQPIGWNKTAHACDNCDGINPTTCLTAPKEN